MGFGSLGSKFKTRIEIVFLENRIFERISLFFIFTLAYTLVFIAAYFTSLTSPTIEAGTVDPLNIRNEFQTGQSESPLDKQSLEQHNINLQEHTEKILQKSPEKRPDDKKYNIDNNNLLVQGIQGQDQVENSVDNKVYESTLLNPEF